jgi:hypothetical protein
MDLFPIRRGSFLPPKRNKYFLQNITFFKILTLNYSLEVISIIIGNIDLTDWGITRGYSPTGKQANLKFSTNMILLRLSSVLPLSRGPLS